MDIIDVKNLVTLLKDRCGKIDISNETEYPTTRGLLMHAAILIEDRILNMKSGTVGHFFIHNPFTYSTMIKIIDHTGKVIRTGEFGDLVGDLEKDVFDMEIDNVSLGVYISFPTTDVVEPVLEIQVK